jgi:hypothetical protein
VLKQAQCVIRVQTNKGMKMPKLPKPENTDIPIEAVIAMVISHETDLKIAKQQTLIKGFCLGTIATWLIVIAICTFKQING